MRPRSLLIGAVFGLVALAALAAAALSADWHLLAIAIALASGFAAATLLSKAARIADQLPSLVGRSVRVEVWGEPLESNVALEVRSVRVIGAGLHIYLRFPPAQSTRDLKIAQPSDAQVTETQLTIGKAVYISLSGTKLNRRDHKPALRVSWPAA